MTDCITHEWWITFIKIEIVQPEKREAEKRKRSDPSICHDVTSKRNDIYTSIQRPKNYDGRVERKRRTSTPPWFAVTVLWQHWCIASRNRLHRTKLPYHHHPLAIHSGFIHRWILHIYPSPFFKDLTNNGHSYRTKETNTTLTQQMFVCDTAIIFKNLYINVRSSFSCRTFEFTLIFAVFATLMTDEF